MYEDYAVLEKCADSPTMSLTSVWLLDADLSYIINKPLLSPNSEQWHELIAIRTVAGDGEITLYSGKTIPIHYDSLLIVRLRDIKSYRCTIDKWRFWWFSFFSNIEQYFTFNKLLKVGMDDKEEKKVYECLRLLNSDNLWRQREACAVFSQLIYEWIYKQHEHAGKRFKNEDIIIKAKSYIKSNLDKALKVSDISKKFGFCENQFRNLFKKKYDMTPKTYIIKERVSAAKALLSQTNLSMLDISQRLGYSSQFHFTKEFVNRTGKNPSQFRQYI